MTIGDITGIAALIVSLSVFWFNRRRSRKSEQIKIARDLGERIEVKAAKLDQNWLSREGAEGNMTLDDFIDIRAQLEDLKYFSYLVRVHEIVDKNTLRYYIPYLHYQFRSVERFLFTTKNPDGGVHHDLLDALNDIKNSIRPWLDKYSRAEYVEMARG